tara:strand:- start:10015 stop:10698 length:684 start_codon:yes stop_codon:yes gene_type:complete
MSNYLVKVNQPDDYKIGVDYEIPSKSIQYTNLVLDDISSGFNGIGKTFSLTTGGGADSYNPLNDQQIIVCKNNLVQNPATDFVTAASNIIFTTAPLATDNVFIIALSTTADLTRTVNYVIDSGSIAMLPGSKGKITIDVSGIIESITVLSDQTGDVVFDISKSSYSNYPTFTSITSGQRVQLTQTDKHFDDVLNNWDKTIIAGDILEFGVVSVNQIRRFLISLKLKL